MGSQRLYSGAKPMRNKRTLNLQIVGDQELLCLQPILQGYLNVVLECLASPISSCLDNPVWCTQSVQKCTATPPETVPRIQVRIDPDTAQETLQAPTEGVISDYLFLSGVVQVCKGKGSRWQLILSVKSLEM